jgi:tripartite-type tricarboxylate transporter receptor subunit TctC
MQLTRTVIGIAVIAGMTSALAQAQTPAEDFPSKPINLIVPFAPGGATDILARTVAQELSQRLGQPVIVDNRPGGSGNIGASAAARAAPDGYTLLMATSSHAINQTLYKNLNYKLDKDLVALSNIASVPLMLVVHPGVPAETPKALADHARANAGKLNFGSGGVGTAAHLAGELFNATSEAQMVHVPYKGGAPATTDLVGGQIQLMFANLPEVMNQVNAGQLRALALTGDKRHPQQPNVPTFVEAGYTGMDLKSWFGLFAPSGVPAATVDMLSREIAASVATPTVSKKIMELGGEPIGNTHEAFQPFVTAEIRNWGAIVEKSGASVD